ncbi:MAG: pentapeptide repeat-containing protein [Candidatus Berkiellales bacterium]
MRVPQHDLYTHYKSEISLARKLKRFVKQRGVELTIAIVGSIIGIATVLVSHNVGYHQEILQASRTTDSYFNGITDLFAKSVDENQRINLIIIARTEAIIEDLNQLKKPDKIASIITFISSINPKLFYKDVVTETPREKYISLSEIKLTGSTLHNIILENANLSYTDLRKCNLTHTNLQFANLKKANLGDANLEYANINHANLQGANLKNAKIYQATFINTNLENAIWINGIRCKKGSIGHCVY